MLVIGAGQINAENRFVGPPSDSGNGINTYPTLAQIAGHALNSIFLDSLEVDLERLQRINRTNSMAALREGLTLSDALAVRDALESKQL